MKFLAVLAAFFGVLYTLLVAHALLYPKSQKVTEIDAVALHVKDAKLSVSFPSPLYQRFVYVP